MQFLGLTITRTKAPANLQMPESRGGWYPLVREGFTGAWQRNIDTPIVDVLSHPTVYRCVTLIAGDVAKMRLQLVEDIGNDVWIPVESAAFSPVLRRPNHYQTPFQFVFTWMVAKLQSGNSYILQQRDGRGVVVAQYVLDPWRVRPLVSPDGSVFYELKPDPLSQVPNIPPAVVVPASEIIHDRMNPLFHPLVGISPLYAAGIPAILGLKILTNSAHFFQHGATPGGILTVPGQISPQQAQDMKAEWETNFGGVNAGRIAVMAEGMKFESVGMVSSDKAQTTEQWSAASEAIANAYGVPWCLVGGPPPPYTNPQALSVQYYTQCIQHHTKPFEDTYEFGVGLAPDLIAGRRMGVEFNRNDLLLMDTATQIDAISKGISSGAVAINEARAQLNLKPLTGGETPYLQQQNYPLESLANRTPPEAMAPPQQIAAPAEEDDDEPDADEARKALALLPAANEVRAKLLLPAVAA